MRATAVGVPVWIGVAVAQSTSVGGHRGREHVHRELDDGGASAVVTTAKCTSLAPHFARARERPSPRRRIAAELAGRIDRKVPSSATATSIDDVEAHTSRSTLAPGTMVIAATTFCPAAGVSVTPQDVENVSFAPGGWRAHSSPDRRWAPRRRRCHPGVDDAGGLIDEAVAVVVDAVGAHLGVKAGDVGVQVVAVVSSIAVRVGIAVLVDVALGVLQHATLVASTWVAIWQSLPLSQETTGPATRIPALRDAQLLPPLQ